MRKLIYILIACFFIACDNDGTKTSKLSSDNAAQDKSPMDEGQMKDVYDNYIGELSEFDSLSQLMAKSKSVDSINYYTNIIESKFSSSANVNIQDKYSRVFDFAFSQITTTEDNTMDAYKACLANPNTAILIQSKCLYRLTSQLLRKNQIDEAYSYYEVLDQETKKILDTKVLEGYETIKQYQNTVSKPKPAQLAQDTFEYLNCLAVKPICHSIWLDQTPCKDYNLLDFKLKAFVDKYPKSLLADDAQLLIYESQLCDHPQLVVNEAKIKVINYYNLIKQYPNTNQIETIRYRIIKNQNRIPNSKIELERISDLFIKNFPNSKYLSEVQNIIAQLK